MGVSYITNVRCMRHEHGPIRAPEIDGVVIFRVGIDNDRSPNQIGVRMLSHILADRIDRLAIANQPE